MKRSDPPLAVLIRGEPADCTATVRHMQADTPHSLYIVMSEHSPAEDWNRAAAMRSESQLLFLEAGLIPIGSRWLSTMCKALRHRQTGAVVGTVVGHPRCVFAGLLTSQMQFEALGGFDSARITSAGCVEEYITRILKFGNECLAPSEVRFLADSTQLKRAS